MAPYYAFQPYLIRQSHLTQKGSELDGADTGHLHIVNSTTAFQTMRNKNMSQTLLAQGLRYTAPGETWGRRLCKEIERGLRISKKAADTSIRQYLAASTVDLKSQILCARTKKETFLRKMWTPDAMMNGN